MNFTAVFDPYFALRGSAPLDWFAPWQREVAERAETKETALANRPLERPDAPTLDALEAARP